MTRPLLIAACLFVAASPAFGAAPTLDDYAQGIDIDAPSGTPLIETTLPDAVYQAVTRADLGDVRVFNAEGQPVPHAFCTAPIAVEPAITEESLPVFELRDAPVHAAAGARIEIRTGRGADVVVEPVGPDAEANGRTHIMDAHDSSEPIRAVQFDWQSPDGASQVKVSIWASDDLDRWAVIVPASTLLHATMGDKQLTRERVELPARAYRYLRVQRVDGGEPLVITSVIAERVGAAQEIEPAWFMATNHVTDDPEVLFFDTGRRAPVTYARLRLPQDNSSVRVTLHSRDDAKAPWSERWHGEAYRIVSDTQRRESPPGNFDATSDRYWRVKIAKDPQLYRETALELGYRPARLRFLAQGSGPFTLAYGSKRAAVSMASACDALLADVGSDERSKLVAEGSVQTPRVLGGDAALRPPPKQTPVRLVVLWSVLIVGVGVLLAMALILLKRVRSG
ncbi:MAG TPA: DUF3999 domain-containing protein [Steroidobacteraceae bacterium]|jgi:hypothetical protein